MRTRDHDPRRPPEPTRRPVLAVAFPDGSRFVLPEVWEDVFADTFGFNPDILPEVETRLRFLVAKYEDHQAWPSKFDGIGMDDESEDDLRYDVSDFYWEHWDDERHIWTDRPVGTPTSAAIAEAVLYQSMRGGLMQKALQTLAEETGRPAPRVVTPEQLLREMEADGET